MRKKAGLTQAEVAEATGVSQQRVSAIVWGSEIRFGVSWGHLGSDLALVGEPAEDLLPADSVLGEVDRFWFAFGPAAGWR
jgi:hypothetical protein